MQGEGREACNLLLLLLLLLQLLSLRFQKSFPVHSCVKAGVKMFLLPNVCYFSGES